MIRDPLVPSDIDLSSFPFMPLMIERLKQSRAWLLCKKRPELAFYMINLWTACWHQQPAASLEDDDIVLADFAMCPDDEVWASIKAVVLRGWVKCSDGRLYHPYIAERALVAWNSKIQKKNQTEAARKAALEKKKALKAAKDGASSVTDSAAEPVTESNRTEQNIT